jgi:nucleotide-binding universal stress UspA family protein
MSCIVVGYDGSPQGDKAIAFAKNISKLIGDCEIALVFVIEWSPYSFHTPEELEERHQRREQEIEQASDHVLKPVADKARSEGFTVSTEVRHGDAAKLLDAIAKDRGANQIIVGRTGTGGLRDRVFGTVSAKLVAATSVPVTIIP